jgi:hypothetical protein
MRCVRDKDSKKAKRNSAHAHPLKRRRAVSGARPSTAKRLATKNAGFRRRKSLTARQKADQGMFLSMRELSELTGFGENKLNAMKRRSGFPLFENKTTLAKFQEWAFSNASRAEDTGPCSQTVLHQPHSGGNTSYERFR